MKPSRRQRHGARARGTGCAGRRATRGRVPSALRPGLEEGWAARAAGSRGGLPGGGAWRSGRAVRPGRDLREVGGAQPRWALEAAAPPRAGGSGGRPRASGLFGLLRVEGSRRARAWSSGVQGYAVARGQNRQRVERVARQTEQPGWGPLTPTQHPVVDHEEFSRLCSF